MVRVKKAIKEIFTYGDYVFDITAAKELIKDIPVVCTYRITDRLNHFFGDDEIVWEHNPDLPGTKRLASQLGVISIDKHRALTDVINLTYPIIAVFIDNELLVIDGYHRLYKAWKTGVKVLPMQILSPESCALICTRKVLKEKR